MAGTWSEEGGSRGTFSQTPPPQKKSTYWLKLECERPVPCGLVAVTLLPAFLPGSEKKAERPLLPAVEMPAGREPADPPLPGSPACAARAEDDDDSFLPRRPSRKLGRRCMDAPPAPGPPLAAGPAPAPASLPLDVCLGVELGAGGREWSEAMEPIEEDMERAEAAEAPSSSLVPPLLRPRFRPSSFPATCAWPSSSSSPETQWSSCTGASSFRHPTASFTSCLCLWVWTRDGCVG